MGTFVHNPGVQVFIEITDKTTGKRQVLDVSEDLTQGQIIRRSDGISTFSFALQNPARKYDYDPKKKVPRPIFTPMDRIIVNMKRLKWVRVFTGYLDKVPAFQVWPGQIDLQASCSLKRLQYWYWDATLPASEMLILRSLSAGQNNGAQDGGTANVIRALLQDVVNWPPEKVHIGAVPDQWYNFASDLVQDLIGDLTAAQAAGNAALAASSGTSVANGVSSAVTVIGVLRPGNYGDEVLDSGQCAQAENVFNAATAVKAGTTDIMLAMATALDESELQNVTFGDRDSVGLFQQRPSQGWGTVQQCEDPTYATQKFLSVLANVTNRWKGDSDPGIGFGASCQAVQRSYDASGSNYLRKKNAAVAIVQALLTEVSAANTGANVSTAKTITTPIGITTGQDLVNVAVALVERNPRITYAEVNNYGSDPANPNPTNLDCSSFVRWVYFNALGRGYDMPRTAAEQAQWCDANGGQFLLASDALKTPGAMLYRGGNQGNYTTVGHTGISLGDGIHTVGAHHSGTYASVEVDTQWSFGFLAPHASYPTVGQGDGVGVSGNTATVTQANGGAGIAFTDTSDANDPIDKLFNTYTWAPTPDTAGEALSSSLTGVKALLNDEPILPYLINLTRSAMRSVCSAPNGDFMAWFPDYFGLWGTAAAMVIEDVELMNFQVTWSDLELVTHQFVSQAFVSTFDLGQAAVSTIADDTTLVNSTGVVSIDMKHIMKALFDLDPSVKDLTTWRNNLYQRFGARPNFEALQGITGAKGEFFMALFLFMQNWAKQFSATVPMTFMPELWPGMLIQLPSYNFQAYVVTVTHTFQMGDGGSFQTSAEIIAPSRMDGTNPLHYGLPLAGTFKPGPGYKAVEPAKPPVTLSGGKWLGVLE